MIPIQYNTGDATKPAGTGNRVIAHICNDYGGWGAGFVLALSARCTDPELVYRRWFASKDTPPTRLGDTVPFTLGEVMLAPFDQPNVCVANMIAQKGDHVHYGALYQALANLRSLCQSMDMTVHMPRIGCGLGGGSWDEVSFLIEHQLCRFNIEVVVYDLPPKADSPKCE